MRLSRCSLRRFLTLSSSVSPPTARAISDADREWLLTLVSQGEQALDRARKEMGEFADVFEAGVLPASIEVHLKRGQTLVVGRNDALRASTRGTGELIGVIVGVVGRAVA